MTDVMSECAYCHTREGKFRCSGCKRMMYCGKQCQKDDWKTHKSQCYAFRPLNCNSKQLDQLVNERACSEESGDAMVRMMEVLSDMAPRSIPRTLEVPPYHEEYRKVYPNERSHYKALKENVNQQKLWSLDANYIHTMEWTQGIYIKRYGEVSPRLFRFLENNPKPGCIFESYSPIQGNNSLYQTMKNIPVDQLDLERGKCYVFAGHVDFHQLIMASVTEGDGKVLFVGYEKCVISVARCHVLYEMIKMSCDAVSILQVWFSTGWGDRTSENFKTACKRVLENEDITDGAIRELLQHWLISKLSLKNALHSWYETCFTGKMLHVVANLSTLKDRVGVCRYSITGQIFGDLNSQRHGNVTMFSHPTNFAHYQQATENFLSTISLDTLSYTGELMKDINLQMISKVEELTENVKLEIVGCIFKVANVSIGNKKCIDEISSLNPHHIEWSNLSDYTHKDEFCNLAKACSVEYTTHRAYFMNWSKYVFGTFILDYGKKAPEVHDAFKKVFDMEFHRLHSLGKLPFFRNDIYVVHPLNLSSDTLSNAYRKYFVGYFFNVSGMKINIGTVSQESQCNFFQRCGHTFHVRFTFDY